MPKPAPFDWMEVRKNPDLARAERDRREAMYRVELEDRAAMLQRLGHGRETTRVRLAANLDWDFAPGSSPVSPAALDGIVDRVFGPAPGGRAVPRSKGGAR